MEGVKSYADVTSSLVEAARAASKASNVGIAVDGTYVELRYADEEKRKAEVAQVLSQIPVAKELGAGCMGSETTNMAKQPGISRKEAQEALLRSLGEILPACEEPVSYTHLYSTETAALGSRALTVQPLTAILRSALARAV